MKAKNKMLILNRSGEFVINVGGDSHCGINKELLINYQVKVQCKAKTDSRGFLFDQLTVDQFFKKMKRTKLSCELLSEKCAKKLIKVIMQENPACEIDKIELTLSPFPHAASMTYCMEK